MCDKILGLGVYNLGLSDPDPLKQLYTSIQLSSRGT